MFHMFQELIPISKYPRIHSMLKSQTTFTYLKCRCLIIYNFVIVLYRCCARFCYSQMVKVDELEFLLCFRLATLFLLQIFSSKLLLCLCGK